jgi:hypothetical protein
MVRAKFTYSLQLMAIWLPEVSCFDLFSDKEFKGDISISSKSWKRYFYTFTAGQLALRQYVGTY